MAVLGEGGVIVEDVRSGSRKIATPHGEAGGAAITYTHVGFADGRRLVSLDTTGTVWVWDTQDWTLKLKGSLRNNRLEVKAGAVLDCDDRQVLGILSRVSGNRIDLTGDVSTTSDCTAPH